MMPPSIFSYVKEQETEFETEEIQPGENWFWNFRNHVQLIFHMKNGIFYTGQNNWKRAFKNIMEPMLNLAYWTEDIEVKDVVFFTENSEERVQSFLLKKYHDEVFTRQHDLDTLFDEITESDLDYGGVLVQRTNSARPEVLALNNVAFCDQTDILGGPIAFKHHFAPDKLMAMAKNGWGDEKNGATISLRDLVVMATDTKTAPGTRQKQKNNVTGKSIEVYVLRGSLPEHYLEDNDNMDNYFNQVHVIGFYNDKDGHKQGVTLYKKKEVDTSILFHTSKSVPNRALGRGVGESLLHPQLWTNFLTVHKTAMLAAGAKVPLVTDDQAFVNKNKVQDMENLEVTTISEGRSINLIPTIAPNNIALYQNAINEWFEHAQLTGSAFDPVLGKEAVSGTTFRGQERTVAQGRGLHDRRRGQRAKFIEKIYREWIIPHMAKEIARGKEFLATLSSDELRWVADTLATKAANAKIKQALLEGNILSDEEVELIKSVTRENIIRSGNKKLIKILGDEFKDIEIRMGINIAGKQKDLVNLSDKILSIFQFVFANPQAFQQAMQVPALAKAFQDILEFSGMSQSDFLSLITAPAPLPQQEQQAPPELALNQAPAEV